MSDMDELESLLKRGLGRAVLFLQQHDSAQYRDTILHACLHNISFDVQTEPSRAPYMYDVIVATGEPEFYARFIRSALLFPDDEDSPYQLLEMAKILSQHGDERARQALYTAFARNIAAGNDAGAEEIVELDGIPGFLFVANRFIDHPQPEEDRWYKAWLLETLQKNVGADMVKQALEDTAANDPRMRAYLEEVRQADAVWKARHRSRGPFIVPSYEEIHNLVGEPGRKFNRPRWARWGERADDALVAAIAADLLAEQDDDRIYKYLHFFEKRRFPLDQDRLLALAHHPETEIRREARRALGNITSPEVRAFGLELLAAETPWEGVALLVNNSEAGDYRLLEDVATRNMSDDEYHWLGYSMHDFCKAHLTAYAAPVLTTLYEKQPCILCRHRVVEMLAELDLVPAWMRDECRYDADLDTRTLVTEETAC